jgi:hypothetical protein
MPSRSSLVAVTLLLALAGAAPPRTGRETIADLKTEDDSQTFTLKLPRQMMTEIKKVAFLDAKGEAIEGRSTGTGYMNDAAEMNFTVKTAAKTLTLEFANAGGPQDDQGAVQGEGGTGPRLTSGARARA